MPGEKEAAEYIATLAAELAAIARKHGLTFQAYLLEMAAAEATETVRAAQAADAPKPHR